MRLDRSLSMAVFSAVMAVSSSLLPRQPRTGQSFGHSRRHRHRSERRRAPGRLSPRRARRPGLTQQTVTGQKAIGAFRLPSGTYEVSFELDGFKRLVRSGIIVEAATTRVGARCLEVGGLSETVQVTADANLLTMTTPTTARSLTSAELEAVPTSTGSFTHLLSSEAGVSADLPPVLINGTGNISPSVNGTRTTSTSLFFNGIDATNLTSNEGSMSDNIAPASDMLEEIKLQTSMYDASTGRSGGGNFQLVTRSGTNAFRGAAPLQLPAREPELERLLLREGRHRQAESAAQRGRIHHRRTGPAESVLLLWRLPADQAETGFVPTASSITVLPQALQFIQGARTKESILAAFAAVNPGFCLDSQGAMLEPDRHGVHLRRRAQPAEPAQSGHGRLRDRCAARGRNGARQRHRGRARQSGAIPSSGSATSFRPSSPRISTR